MGQKNNSVTSAETNDDSSTKSDVTTSSQLAQTPILGVVLPKTKKCDWCKKIKSAEQGYCLGKFERKKDWFICQQCNLEKEVV